MRCSCSGVSKAHKQPTGFRLLTPTVLVASPSFLICGEISFPFQNGQNVHARKKTLAISQTHKRTQTHSNHTALVLTKACLALHRSGAMIEAASRRSGAISSSLEAVARTVPIGHSRRQAVSKGAGNARSCRQSGWCLQHKRFQSFTPNWDKVIVASADTFSLSLGSSLS